ncbi:metallophosphoesterase family protein [Methanococcoides burtonii]|uniref:Metallophosphoesterase-domain protein n=1 Tax=Methanococcoides burtonii (strain DSM 6242 / NBRC 107633 / OCM 468 / ACE-M) TaxID=259564 RepID=Q12WJ5_METBU|nr:DNA repair exonuclease [Methanococcoides burtonii]ABE52181.1 metallophosphoesterase-domain protein [Methanococcoides burtonii DSM 6242]
MTTKKRSKIKDGSNLIFVHAADLHLDSPFLGLSEINTKLSQVMAKATFDAYNNIIDLCIEKNADFLLISGDIYDSADKSLYAQLKFLEGLKRLSSAGIAAYITHGNHDPLNGWSASLEWPANVKIFSGDDVETVFVEKDGNVIASINGISYRTKHIQENLAKRFQKKDALSPFTIGMLHCTVDSGGGHYPYAPCSIQDLKETNYDYWALGHIHYPQVLETDPYIVYSGNPQGRNPGELGERGCTLVEVDQKGNIKLDFVPVDSVRWYVEELYVDGLETEAELIELLEETMDKLSEIAEGRYIISRFILRGRSPLKRFLMKDDSLNDLVQHLRDDYDVGSGSVWVERLQDKTSFPIERESLLNRQDFISDLLSITDEICSDNEGLMKLDDSLHPLFGKGKIRHILMPLDEDERIRIARNAEELLLEKLISEGEYENN